MPPELRPPSDLIDFCKFVEGNKELQSSVKRATNAKEILDIAQAAGFTFSIIELRIWSRELSAAWFPWSGKNRDWRRSFFCE